MSGYEVIRDAAERYRTREIAGVAGGGRKSLPSNGPKPVRARPLQLDGEDTRPRAASREACPHCGARGDLGCDHFAPCSQDDMPRPASGILNENGKLARGAFRHG